MAELNTDSGGGKKGSGKVRSKKSNSKVDLTAMGRLSFPSNYFLHAYYLVVKTTVYGLGIAR